MKRRLLTILIFLLAGALVNVAVAWALVYYGTPKWLGVNPLSEVDPPVASRAKPYMADSTAVVGRFGAFGFREYDVVVYESHECDVYGRDEWCVEIVKELDFLFEHGESPSLSNRALMRGLGGQAVILVEGGLPFRTLSGVVVIQETNRTWWEQEGHQIGVTRLTRRFHGIDLLRHVPHHPLWGGVMLNTIFYAVALWLLILGPFALRRLIRLRRGLCPACAYPMGQALLCTECGRELPDRARPAT